MDAIVEPMEAAPGTKIAKPAGRWWMAVGVGTLFSIPTGWLLSYGAPLMYWLGLFFFVLFGLLMGAVVFRVASKGRPYGKGPLMAGTTIIVLVCWGIALAKEVHEAPTDMARDVSRATRDIGDRSVHEFRAEVAQQMRAFLETRYPPGGVLGAIRWIATSGEVKVGEIAVLNRAFRRDQRGFWWSVRVVLSIAMLGFGVASQTFLLAKPA